MGAWNENGLGTSSAVGARDLDEIGQARFVSVLRPEKMVEKDRMSAGLSPMSRRLHACLVICVSKGAWVSR